MKKAHKLILDGKHLSVADLWFFLKNSESRVEISSAAWRAMEQSEKFLLSRAEEKIIYGVNTGFGPMASRLISAQDYQELQVNLIRSHAVGMGEPINPDFVLAAMIIRLNTFAKGFSGVSRELAERLQDFINHRIIPIVPEHGAVGTSGDLVQLAHIALALIGEGEVWYKGVRQRTANVLKKLKFNPYQLKVKEGLAMINGTAVMTGIAALNIWHSERILNAVISLSAFALELVQAFEDSIAPELHATRPHRGQLEVARLLREITKTSKLLRPRQYFQSKFEIPQQGVNEISEEVQEVYSFRCSAQILGPILDSFKEVKREVEVEMNSVTDNPIIDARHKLILHGGNFHGDYIAYAMDRLKIGLAKLTLLCERRINFFLNKNLNKRFPPFLNLKKEGLTLALQGLQFVATSTAAQNQSLAFPHSVHSISTNADNQDVVSMGSDAALFAAKVIENVYIVLVIELVVLLQALEVQKVFPKLSVNSRELAANARKVFPPFISDRALTKELERLSEFVKFEFEPVVRIATNF